MSQPRPIRVAHVIFALGVGGLETGLINVIRRLQRPEFEHHVFCMKELGPNQEPAEEAGAETTLVGSMEGSNRFIILRLRKLFRKWRPDVVHTRNFGALDAVIAARLARVPVVVHGEHGWDVPDIDGSDPRRRRIRGLLSRFIDHYVTVSNHLEHWLLEHHRGRFAGKVQTIHNGTQIDRFLKLGGVPIGDDPVVATVGRLAAVKDQRSLIEAFSPIAVDHPNARLEIFGDGPERASLEEAIAATACADRIALPGFSTDVDSVYARLRVFALPSLNEGISNTILEAMAAGLPVVATAVGGNPELVVDGETGRLVPSRDPAALAAALRSYVEDPELARKHGDAGRERARIHFSLDRMAEDYASMYRRLVERKR